MNPIAPHQSTAHCANPLTEGAVAHLSARPGKLLGRPIVEGPKGSPLRPTGMESGGFYVRGSSPGKSTALAVAARETGHMQRWRTTDDALGAIAAQHRDSLLVLDEPAQAAGKLASQSAHVLADGGHPGATSGAL